LLARRRRAVGAADSRVEEAERNPAQFDRATIDAIKQKAFELAESPQSDPKDVKAILTLVLKARDQDIEERRVAILEARAKQAEQAEAVLQQNVSPEEQAARIREIFKR
jgi:hypothetical protein